MIDNNWEINFSSVFPYFRKDVSELDESFRDE